MIQELLNLSNKLEKTFDKENFSQQAYESLESLQITCNLLDLEIQISKLISEKKLPKQVNLYNVFGQPPITIFNNNKFATDLYFWQDNDTSIHSHSFRGAFKIFSGHSLHEQFSVKRLDDKFEDIYLSKIELSRSELLSTGNTHQINSGEEFIHRLVHLSNPTVTICLRTVDDLAINQWQYFSSGVSIQKNNISESELKELFFIEYLFQQGRSSFQSKLNCFLEQLSLSKQFNLFEKLHLHSFGFSEEFNGLVLELLEIKIQANDYYKHYENYYIEAQEYIMPIEDTPEDRLIVHYLNNKMELSSIKNFFQEFSINNLDQYLRKYQ